MMMGDVSVNYLAVLLAAVSSMVVGSIWYSMKVFGKTWVDLAKVQMGGGQPLGPMLGMTFVLSLITAYILAHVSFLSNHFFGNSFLQDSLTTALFMWLGFTACRIAVHDMFEGRRKKLTLLTVGHELVTFVVMGLVIGLMGV